jgi:hypothetical protein
MCTIRVGQYSYSRVSNADEPCVGAEARDGVLEWRVEVDAFVDVEREIGAVAGEVVVGADEEMAIDCSGSRVDGLLCGCSEIIHR